MITAEVAMTAVAGCIPLTAAIIKFVPRRVRATPDLQAEIAAINTALRFIQRDMSELKSDIRELRGKLL